MKFLILAALIAAASALSYRDVLSQEYNLYKAEYGKTYEDPLEHERRLEAFIQTKYEVAEHNLKYKNGEVTYDMEINEYADWLPEELEARNGFNKEYRDRVAAGEDVAFPEIEDLEVFNEINPAAPDYVNWAEKGVLAPVENQGRCGSCYAFSALGALEAALYIKNKKLDRLSKQQVVDCSRKYGNMGCNGGFTTKTYDYVRDSGSNSEASYPYEGRDASCRYSSNKVVGKCTSHVRVSASEEALKNAVATVGPISIAINTLASLQKYKSGVYYDPSCRGAPNNLNHAVVLVGYGTDKSTKQDYWIVKNSWGSGWGERGYVRMARNKNNHCGVATLAVYPRV